MSFVESNFSFFDTAREAVGSSHIVDGRTKVSTDYLIANFPNGVTVTGFDILTSVDKKTGEAKRFPVITIAENSEIYANCGVIMLKIAEKWAEHFGGDTRAASDSLASVGGVRFLVQKNHTTTGQTLTVFTPVKK